MERVVEGVVVPIPTKPELARNREEVASLKFVDPPRKTKPLVRAAWKRPETERLVLVALVMVALLPRKVLEKRLVKAAIPPVILVTVVEARVEEPVILKLRAVSVPELVEEEMFKPVKFAS